MAVKTKALTVKVRIDDVRPTLAAFKRLPQEANDSLRKRSMELAETLAGRVRAAATAEGRQAAALARTVKPRRDRVPVIVAGGTTRLGRNKKPAFKLLFGSEFGSDRLPQYKPHRGRSSYWFFDSVEHSQAEIGSAWTKVADDIAKAFARGGGS